LVKSATLPQLLPTVKVGKIGYSAAILPTVKVGKIGYSAAIVANRQGW